MRRMPAGLECGGGGGRVDWRATAAVHRGQIPEDLDGELPADFEGQARQVWRNIEAQLRAADMTLDNLVKVTTFLSDRRYGPDNRRVREEVLAGRHVALTVIITGIFEEKWLLEIEAVAAA